MVVKVKNKNDAEVGVVSEIKNSEVGVGYVANEGCFNKPYLSVHHMFFIEFNTHEFPIRTMV